MSIPSVVYVGDVGDVGDDAPHCDLNSSAQLGALYAQTAYECHLSHLGGVTKQVQRERCER